MDLYVAQLIRYEGQNIPSADFLQTISSIVSGNVCYNNPAPIEEIEAFLREALKEAQAICFQDFPEAYVDSLVKLGHVACYPYALGRDGNKVCNCIVFSPNLLFENIQVEKYIVSDEISKDFHSGCFLVRCGDMLIGSVYDSFLSTVSRRRKAWHERQNYVLGLLEPHQTCVLVGDYNPRGTFPIQERSCLHNIYALLPIPEKIKKIGYLVNVLPSALGVLVNSPFGPKRELATSGLEGLLIPSESTFKNKKIGPICLNFEKNCYTLDCAQILGSPLGGTIQVLKKVSMSDHYPVRVTIAS